MRRMFKSGPAELAVLSVAMLCGAIAFTWPLAADPAWTLPGPGDSKYNAWVLGWVADRTRFALAGVWDAPIFYPYPNTLTFAEPLLGVAVPLAPVYWLGANAVLLHNIAVWASFVVAGTGGYMLGRELTGSRRAGVVCGAIAAFLPYRLAHLSHIQVLMGAWLWWTAWSIHRYFRAPSLAGAVRSALLFVLLALSSLYWIYVSALPLAAIIAIEYWRRRPPLRTWTPHLAVAAVLCAAALLPVGARMYALTTARSPLAATEDRFVYGADLLAFVSTHRDSLLWRALPSGNGETDFFPGVTVLVFAAAALVLQRRLRIVGADAVVWLRVYGAVGLAGAALALGPTVAYAGRVLFENPLLPWLSSHVPGFSALRTPARFILVAQLALSVLASLGVAAVLALLSPSRRTATIAAGVLAGLVFTEGLARSIDLVRFSPYEGRGGRYIAGWLARRPGGAVMELPLDGWGPFDYSMTYQARTLVHRHPLVEGVSRYRPPLPTMLAEAESPLVDPARIPEAVPFLRALGVRHVVVHEALYAERALGAAIRDAFRRAAGRGAAELPDVSIFDLGAPPALPTLVGDEIPPQEMTLSVAEGDAAAMLDGSVETGWDTGRPQAPGDTIEISLDRPRLVTGVRLRLARDTLTEYPRALDVIAYETAHPHRIAAGSVLVAFGEALRRDPVAPVIELRWPPIVVGRLLLRQTGRSSRRAWAVHELRLVGAGAR